jgi:8-oxo-dGTP pyrophosphatase MutT (NUDIX family)
MPSPAPLTDPSSQVRAAGGVIHRSGSHGLEVGLVHRPRYDDWTFPKGKLTEGETEEQGALREVLEETGLRCRLGPYLGSRRYKDRHRRDKIVRYWRMTPEGGAFKPSDEVDRFEWLPISQALERLTYPRDRELLRSMERETDPSADQSTNL